MEDLRAQLLEVGPQNTDSLMAKWHPIHDIAAGQLTEQVTAEAGPQAYFLGRGLVAAEADGVVYLLLYTSDPKSDRRRYHWSIESTGRSVDGGRPAAFRLDQAGGQGMSRPPAGRQIIDGTVLDGKVYTADAAEPHLQQRPDTGSFLRAGRRPIHARIRR